MKLLFDEPKQARLRLRNGKYGTTYQKALESASDYKRLTRYLLSVNIGVADKIRRLENENKTLKNKLNEYERSNKFRG